MRPISSRAALRVLLACACVAGAASLAGCGGNDSPAPRDSPLELTAIATDATTTVDVDHPADVSFTISNSGSETVRAVTVYVDSGFGGWLRTTSITCSAQVGTCPDVSASTVPPFDMPAGSRYTFVAAVTAARPMDGAQAVVVKVESLFRKGEVDATAHVTAVDGRSGGYLLFARSGMFSSLDVQFYSGKGTLATVAVSGDRSFTTAADDSYSIFPSGGHLSSGPDMLAGQADFGAGPDTFIALRQFVTSLKDLDGQSFSTFTVARGAAASASDPISGTSGPLDLWQVAIAGSTLTTCTDTIGVIATCDPTRLRTYALSASPGSPVFRAEDSMHHDTFNFEVARSGSSLIYLRAGVAPSDDALFAIGFADAAPPAVEHDAYGTVDGVFGVLTVSSTIYEFLDQKPSGEFGPATPTMLTAAAGSIPGLMTGTRAADGASVYVLQQGALTLIGTSTGEFAIATDRMP